MKTAIKTQYKSTAFMLTAGFFALGCAAMGDRAQAADGQQPLTRAVVYGDLNLDSEQGAKVLYTRLRGAARDVCFPLESRDFKQTLWHRCFDGALASAVAQVDRARVTALHNQLVSHPAKS